MHYLYRSSLFLLFVFLPHSFCNNDIPSKNFIPQQCTDIPFALNPIESIKCIQLVPATYQYARDYSMKNYVLQKHGSCQNVITLNTSSIFLFHVCNEVCIDEYNDIFNNQSNDSIYNIFYSSTLQLQMIRADESVMISYDYLPFDVCSASSQHDRILLIVVYVLCGIIGFLTIAVVIRCIVSWRLRRKPGYEPYNWRWVADFLLCRLHKDNQSSGQQERHVTEVMSFEQLTHATPDQILAIQPNQFDLTSQSYMGSSSDPTRIPNSSTDSSAEIEPPILPNPLRSTYVDVTTPSETTEFSQISTMNSSSDASIIPTATNQIYLANNSSEQTNYF